MNAPTNIKEHLAQVKARKLETQRALADLLDRHIKAGTLVSDGDYHGFLNAVYDLTEIDEVYELARENAPCEACGGDGEVDTVTPYHGAHEAMLGSAKCSGCGA